MNRIVFFGVDGPFSTVPLTTLANAELKPALVVHGMERLPYAPRPIVDVLPHRPGLLERLAAKVGTGRSADTGSLTEHAHRLGIDVVRTSDANCAAVRAAIQKQAPDAIVIAGFPHLLSKRTLEIPAKGGLNVHPGRLPQERGAAPLFWALKEGKTEITVTIHVLDEHEDAGDIVASTKVSFEPGEEGQQVLDRCAKAAAPLLIKAVRSLLAGDLVRVPQDRTSIGRCPRPGFRDGRIDPERSAKEVFTFVAGCAGAYSLFAECGGDRFFVERAVSYDEAASLSFEYVLTGDRLILRCNPGVVELLLKEEGALFTAEYTE